MERTSDQLLARARLSLDEHGKGALTQPPKSLEDPDHLRALAHDLHIPEYPVRDLGGRVQEIVEVIVIKEFFNPVLGRLISWLRSCCHVFEDLLEEYAVVMKYAAVAI
jgi:hypothetical protein